MSVLQFATIVSFSGEVKLARKHTTHIARDLPRLVQSAIGKLMDRWHHQDTRLSIYKLTEIEDRTAHDLIVRATDVGVCPNKLIPRVLHEWREPRHEAFKPRNAWSLFNAFTEVLKGNLVELPRRTEALIPARLPNGNEVSVNRKENMLQRSRRRVSAFEWALSDSEHRFLEGIRAASI